MFKRLTAAFLVLAMLCPCLPAPAAAADTEPETTLPEPTQEILLPEEPEETEAPEVTEEPEEPEITLPRLPGEPVPMGPEDGAEIQALVPTEGQCGDDAWWNYDELGKVLTIYGTGAIWDTPFFSLSAGTKNYGMAKYYAKTVIVEEGITAIGECGLYFGLASDVEEIILPESLTAIGDHGIYNNPNLVSVNLPSRLETVGKYGLALNGSLKEVRLPRSLTYIGDNAFASNNSLTRVISETITDEELPKFAGSLTMGNYVFYSCDSLEEAWLPRSLGALGSHTFYACTKLTFASIPNITVIPNNTFASCYSLKKAQLADNYTELEYGAFINCTGLESITFPKTLEVVGHAAFRSCTALTELSFPEGTHTFEGYAFAECTALTKVNLPKTMQNFGYFTFTKTNLESVDIPAGFRNLGEGVFKECENLKTVTMTDDIEDIYSAAFEGCSQLREIRMSNNLEEIRASAFENCSSLREIYLADTLDYIQDSAFQGSGITSVHFSAVLRHFGSYALANCQNLRSITIDPENKDFTVQDGILYDKKITKLYAYPGGLAPKALNYESITGRNVVVPDTVTELCSGCFAYCDLDTVTLPAGLKYIDGGAFWESRVRLINYLDTHYQWQKISIDSYRNEAITGENRRIHCTDTLSDVDVINLECNQDIVINASGHAFALIRLADTDKMNQIRSVVCEVIGSTDAFHNEQVLTPDANRIVAVDLGKYSTRSSILEHAASVKFVAANGWGTDPEAAKAHEAKITVKPLSYTQNITLSAGVSIGPELDVSVEVSNGMASAYADLLKASATLSSTRALSIYNEYTGNQKSLLLTSANKQGLEGSIEKALGVSFGDGALKTEFMNANKSIGATFGQGYGLSTDRYTASTEQKAMLGAFLFAEASGNLCNSPAISAMILELTNKFLDKTTLGSGMDVLMTQSVAVTNATKDVYLKTTTKALPDDLPLFGGLTNDSNNSAYFEARLNVDHPEKNKLILGASSFSSKGIGSSLFKAGYFAPLTSQTLHGQDVKLTYSDSGSTLKVMKDELSWDTYAKGDKMSHEYHWIDFTPNQMDALLAGNENLRNFVHKSKPYASILALDQLEQDAIKSKDTYSYRVTQCDNLQTKVEFKIPPKILGLKLKLGYSNVTEFPFYIGQIRDGGAYITGVSDQAELAAMVKADAFSLEGLVQDCIAAVGDFLESCWETVKAEFGEKLEAALAVLFPADEDDKADWTVSMSTIQNPESVGSSTLTAMVNTTAMSVSPSIEYQPDYEVSEVMTVSMPYLVTVIDNATGKEVTDLSAHPLKLTIRYNAETLAKAGLTMDSEIVRNGGIRMYEYVEDGNYCQTLETEWDEAACSLTATLLEPGCFVLAVDSCAPEFTSISLSDSGATPTVTAVISDVSGLDLQNCSFSIDDSVVAEGSAFAKLFNKSKKTFTYTVPASAALTEGEHTMVFTLTDGSGNTSEYRFRFTVDLTAPVIEAFTAEGTPNEGNPITVTAKVSDENLDTVFVLINSMEADGSKGTDTYGAMTLVGGTWRWEGAGQNHSLWVRILAIDEGGNKSESEPVFLPVALQELTISHNHIVLRQGSTAQLTAKAVPAEFTAFQWESEDPAIATVNGTGLVTAAAPGTTYILVSAGEGVPAQRCRVDVTAAPEISSVSLGTDALTAKLYSTDYARMDVLVLTAELTAQSIVEEKDNGIALESARFADSAAAELFDLRVVDDRTVAVVPRQNAIDNASSVKSAYSSKIIVAVFGREYETEKALKLTVDKKLPKVTVSNVALDAFYPAAAADVAVKGGEAVSIKVVSAPSWLVFSGTKAILSANAPARASAKVTAEVTLKDWLLPVTAKFTVKVGSSTPKLGLSASSVTLSGIAESTRGIQLQLTSKDTKKTLDDWKVQSVTVSEGFAAENFDLTNGTFTLKQTAEVLPAKATIQVSFRDTDQLLTLPVTVKTAPVTLKTVKSVTLNPETQDSVLLEITASPADYIVNSLVSSIRDSKGQEANDAFELRYADGRLTISCTDSTVFGTSYTLKLKTADSRETSVTLKAAANTTPRLTVQKAITLNKKTGDTAVLPVTASAPVEMPLIRVMDKAGKVSMDGQLDVAYADGKLTVGVNDATQFGMVYSVRLQANEADPESVLTVTIPAETKSNVISKVRVTGAIDPIRDGSEALVVPTLKNTTGEPVCSVTVYRAADGKSFTEDVTGWFETEVTQQGIRIRKVPGTVLSGSFRLAVSAAFPNGYTETGKLTALSVKSAKVKLTVPEAPVLYREDPECRAEFTIEAADPTLNGVTKVEFAKAAQFELFDYGFGTFAIGFKDPAAAKSGKITLNVWLDGKTEKVTTVTLKLTVK